MVHKGGKGKYILFRPKEWEGVAALNAGSRDSVGFFRFVFRNNPNELDLFLESAHGDEVIRGRLFEMGQKNRSLFKHPEDLATKSHPTLYQRAFLTPDFYQRATSDERETEILKNWDDFLEMIFHK